MKYYCDTKRHLICIPYSIENLHKMADNLNIKRCWFHKRIDEITNKCLVISTIDIVRIIRGIIISL